MYYRFKVENEYLKNVRQYGREYTLLKTEALRVKAEDIEALILLLPLGVSKVMQAEKVSYIGPGAELFEW